MIWIGTGCRHLTTGSISKRQQYMEWAEDVSSKKLTTTPLRFYQLEDEKHYEIFEDNLIEELLFLSYFMGDIHQVWDDSITETAEEIFYDCDVENLVKAIQNNIMVSIQSREEEDNENLTGKN
uniref:Uncharacterized protein n=1 Tax=Lactuca sativa TaxID=4236 RepID=A0A9R1WG59_LACSA|nr:hypothetical protein LSAT_V11C200072590 [Lactuca sativa]